MDHVETCNQFLSALTHALPLSKLTFLSPDVPPRTTKTFIFHRQLFYLIQIF